jgi:hypothetical protein
MSHEVSKRKSCIRTLNPGSVREVVSCCPLVCGADLDPALASADLGM